MDLSKIPEPSEGDFMTADYLTRSYAASYLGVPDEEYRRLMRCYAHLLRHGSVLAESLKELVYSASTPDEKTAISFFEKFGGEA